MFIFIETNAGEKFAFHDSEERPVAGVVREATWDGSSPTVTVVKGEIGPIDIPFAGWPQIGIAP